jgi:hypothetical protein
MSPKRERFQPPKLWNAIGTGIGTLTPTMPIWMRLANSHAASPSRACSIPLARARWEWANEPQPQWRASTIGHAVDGKCERVRRVVRQLPLHSQETTPLKLP